MANQPSKYSKFLVGAASAALVASAVAPIASAADFKDTKGNTHEEAINALSDAGVIKGYSDGTFLPNKTLTRSDVVKMMGKWLVTEGHAIPADARTNPRFTDLTTKSNAELLDYAAVVKDAEVFIGSNGKLLAVDNITRENMAMVLVRAFDAVEDIDLATYVAGQDFKRDVKDLTAAKSEARAAIDVLDFFDITNPAVATFNPKGSTTRGHFATFLHKTINADFSKVAGEAAEGVVSVKAVNATTVEVAFKEAVSDVNALKYTIEGLTVSNAAVKQTDNKTVILTTSAQEGGKEYTLKAGESTLGKFTGISEVVPTKITTDTTSLQGIVGKEVTLKADINVKQAGVPVTFNVKADDKLNKDQVVEAITNAEGIATYSYTQYAAGNDDVAVYPTGAPSVRSLAKVYWGVDSILTIVADDKKGEEINNGENKVYKVTYKDAKTGKAVANQKLHVTFAENVDTTIDKITHATVNGKNPSQLTNGKTEAVTVTTNSNGEATLTVSGLNTKATPIVFLDDSVNNRVSGNERLENTELQAKAAQLVIGAVQSSYAIEVTRDGGEEAATGLANGRKYKVTVKTKDGKVAANETVNVAFNEVVDRNMNTNTSAIFTNKDGVQHKDAPGNGQQLSVKLDSKGEGSFIIATATANVKEYATPVVWLDINSSNAKTGTLDEGEPSKVADITYFAEAKLTDGNVTAFDSAGNEVEEDEEFTGIQSAFFKFTAANQSGKEMSLPSGYDRIEATFTVWNTGSNDVKVEGEVVSPNRSITVTRKNSTTPTIEVVSVDNKTTSVRVEARGTAEPIVNNNNWNNNNNRLQSINLNSHTAKATFKSTKDVGVLHTGLITSIDTKDKEIQFEGKDFVSYKGASFKNYYGNNIDQAVFEETINNALAAGKTHKVTLSKDGDKITVSILTDAPVTAPVSVINLRDVNAVANSIEIPTVAQEPGATIALTASTNGVNVAWATSNNGLLSIAGNTATVQPVTKDETVTLTATITKGDAKVTKSYSVKLSPKVDAPVTRGQLLVKQEAAQLEVAKTTKYTAASIATLQSAIDEARAVLASSSPAQADLNSAGKALDVATAGLKEIVVDAPATVTITTATAVGTDLSALIGNYTYTIEGTVAEDNISEVTLTFTDGDADKTITVPVVDNKFSKTILPGETFGVFNKVNNEKITVTVQ
ncbi:S-layer homology domain-containing protein [Sporosarcina sp. FSL K6-6792]|uniref:S-layer homology domain-containing protein n=1 Tax=Sporosarcina sp. FSL K6-6792 TaxID=2921559 RepID=UPI0030FAE1F4